MKEYFDFIFNIKNGIPKITIKIKKSFNKGKAMGINGMPLSPSSLGYFVFHFGEEFGGEIYNFYKRFFNKKNILLFYLQEFSITQEQKDLILKYIEDIDIKMKRNHKEAVSKPEYRKKLSDSSNRELQSKIKKEKYKDPIFKAKMYEKMHNPNTQARRSLSYKKWLENGGLEILRKACNKPERIAKISAHSKLMWKKWKYSTSFPKNYEINGIKMNSVEFKIASVLNEMNIRWKYEKEIDTLDGVYLPDFTIQYTNKLIECFGDFWHANPNHFLNEEQILIGTTKVKEIWNKDKNRQQVLEDLGYKLLILWEQDINNNLETVKEKIRNFLDE